jgi:hypothetical protein
MGYYHPLDGDTNLKYNLLCFLTPNKKISKRKALAFNRDGCCHLATLFMVDSLPLIAMQMYLTCHCGELFFNVIKGELNLGYATFGSKSWV